MPTEAPRWRGFEAVHPYVPDASIPWEKLEASTAELRTSCSGAFEDPRLNVELRRFLYRDAIPLVTYVAAFLSFGVLGIGQIALGTIKLDVLATTFLAVAAMCGIIAPMDGYAFFRMNPLSPWASAVRIATMVMYVSPMIPRQLLTPAVRVLQCGDIDTIDAANATNSTTVTTAAAVESALADRQQYCIDAMDGWFISAVVVAIAIFRMMPVHAMPALLLFLVLAPVGYVVREQLAPAAEEGYEAKATSIAAQLLVMAVCWGIGFVRCVRSTEIERQRFVAAAEAERARRLAIQELRQVDALLKRALPEAVLERLAVGAHMVDESDDVTVIFAKVDVARRGSSSSTTATRAGGSPGQSQAAVEEAVMVGFLHRVVSEFDEHLASGAGGGVSKVKTVGDVYWAVAGLPEAVACHASAACRFAVGMHATAAQVEDGSGRGELQAVLRVGVHSGSATGAMLGTQRLSYEPFGPACDGARVALRRCAAGTSLVTDGVKRRLGVEARQYAGDVDSEAMFATEGDVDAALEVQVEVGSGAYVLYELPGMARLPGPSALGAEEVLLQLRDDAVSVRSRSVGGLTAGAAALAEGWVSEAMRSQRAQLEQRLGFLLARAAEAEGRRLARLARRESRYRQQHGGASRDDEAAAGGGAAGHDFGIDAAATEQLAALEDPEEGPFAPGSRVPLVYTFADAEEERGYLDFARDVTHVMRRDVRIGTAVLYWACCVFFGATSDNLLTLFVFIVAGSLATLNAGTLVLQALDHADTALGHAAFAAFVVALYVADGHVLGNDPFWAALVYTLTLFQTTWTLSPLARSGLSTLANVAAFAKMAVLQKGLVAENFGMFFAGVVALPVLYALSEKYSRRAYVERRLAEALLAQQGAAQTAQRALLGSIVPPAFARPLQRWFAAGCRAEGHLRQRHEGCPIAALSMQPMVPTAEQGQAGAEWLLEAHRALDALLDRCTVVEKVKTAGDAAVLLWGPGERALMSSADDDTSGRSSSVSHGRTAHSATPGMFAAELLFVVRALEELRIRGVAAMHVGDVTGAVVGTERVSLDVLGQAVGAAEAALEAAVLAQAIVGHGARANNAADPTHDHVGPGGMVTVTQEALGVLRPAGAAADGSQGTTLVSLPAPELASTSGDVRSGAETSSVEYSFGASGGGCFSSVPVEEVHGAPGSAAVYALGGL